jgi:16S rRNA (uracil1498-N3)-methyltransferase
LSLTTGPLREAAALVYLEGLDGEELTCDGHHLLQVLRLRPGELVIAADGAGAWRTCRVGDSSGERRGEARLVALGEIETQAPSPTPVTVAFGLQKGERAEWAVQKLTEIGVDRIVPLLTSRTVVRLEERERPRRGERLRRIAAEAGAQSRRPRLPIVEDPLPFEAFVVGLGENAALAEPGAPTEWRGLDTLLVGPEGGWSEPELASVARSCSLGDSVLRSETAAIVAGAFLAALREGFVVPAPGPPQR